MAKETRIVCLEGYAQRPFELLSLYLTAPPPTPKNSELWAAFSHIGHVSQQHVFSRTYILMTTRGERESSSSRNVHFHI